MTQPDLYEQFPEYHHLCEVREVRVDLVQHCQADALPDEVWCKYHKYLYEQRKKAGNDHKWLGYEVHLPLPK